ncbi:MAG: twin-arginine translocation signal domain-containing protein, partial [Candidatus Aenigmarchaeota archaeon]|nr:twin-arginine translocation signal domain-containing protein [Candidatus Aenigmarchaeota archaeon]
MMDMPLSRRDFIKMAAAVFGACVSAKATGGV